MDRRASTMPLNREQRLKKGTVALETLALTPEEYFVLSRVEGSPTVAEVVAGSGVGKADAERILDKLVEAGALVLSDSSGPPSRPATAATPAVPQAGSLRTRAEERRRQLLRAQLDASTPKPSPVEQAVEAAAEGGEGRQVETIRPPMVSENDERLDERIPIPIEAQRWILALSDGKDTISPFEFLGLIPTHDDKAIQRGYHTTSRKLHPDTYFGKDVGMYRVLLDDLFKRARYYYAELRKVEVRNPYVDAWIEERARRAREAEAEAAAVEEHERAVRETKRRQEEAEAAIRRQQRASARIARQRSEIRSRLSAETEDYVQQAEAAETAGNLPKAANLYRLALRASPGDAELRRKWERVRDVARTNRARDAFTRAQRYEEMGQSAEAGKLYLEAADAEPTAVHLAYATEAISQIDPTQARDFAMAALDALLAEQAAGHAFKQRQLVDLRLMIARGFLAAGLKESARQQVIEARDVRPDDPQVRALLKSLKVK